jgi:hypothetical protein
MFQSGQKVKRNQAYYQWMYENPGQAPFGLNREFTVKTDDGTKVSFEDTLLIDDSKYWEPVAPAFIPKFKKGDKIRFKAVPDSYQRIVISDSHIHYRIENVNYTIGKTSSWGPVTDYEIDDRIFINGRLFVPKIKKGQYYTTKNYLYIWEAMEDSYLQDGREVVQSKNRSLPEKSHYSYEVSQFIILK